MDGNQRNTRSNSKNTQLKEKSTVSAETVKTKIEQYHFLQREIPSTGYIKTVRYRSHELCRGSALAMAILSSQPVSPLCLWKPSKKAVHQFSNVLCSLTQSSPLHHQSLSPSGQFSCHQNLASVNGRTTGESSHD